MSAITNFPLIEISGTPQARGRAYGEAARQRIQASIDLYAGQMSKLDFNLADLPRLTANLISKIEGWAPHHLEEMLGISEGAGVDFQQIVLINARTEIVQMVRREFQAKSAAGEPDGCTGVVILPEASADGDLIHAQTWDWLAECANTSVVLKVLQADGPDILTFTEAGGLARNGFNSAGLAITANYLESERDYRQAGIPLALIRRKVLEQSHLANAIRVVATTPKSTSNNMIISSVEGFAVDLECAPDEVFPLYPDNGIIVHSNHWQSQVALAKLKEMGLGFMPDSLYRDYRVRQHLRPRIGHIGWSDVRDALSDKFGEPFAVCRAPNAAITGNLGATVALVMFKPADGLMEVTPLPALNSEVTQYRLDMDPAAMERAALANAARASTQAAAQ